MTPEPLDAENRRLRHDLQTLQSRHRAALRTIAVLTDAMTRMQPELTIEQAALVLSQLESLRMVLGGEVITC